MHDQLYRPIKGENLGLSIKGNCLREGVHECQLSCGSFSPVLGVCLCLLEIYFVEMDAL